MRKILSVLAVLLTFSGVTARTARSTSVLRRVPIGRSRESLFFLRIGKYLFETNHAGYSPLRSAACGGGMMQRSNRVSLSAAVSARTPTGHNN